MTQAQRQTQSNDQQSIHIPAEKLVDALLHMKQFEQHYATQESVDNLKEQMKARFEQVDKRFEQVDKRFEQVDKRFDELKADNRQTNAKLDRIQWFIVAAALALIFKDYIFKAISAA